MDDLEKAKRQKVVVLTRASLALSGIKESPYMAELNRRFVDGEISIEEAIERVRAKYGLPPILGLKGSRPEE
jgi:hypothetical protein